MRTTNGDCKLRYQPSERVTPLGPIEYPNSSNITEQYCCEAPLKPLGIILPYCAIGPPIHPLGRLCTAVEIDIELGHNLQTMHKLFQLPMKDQFQLFNRAHTHPDIIVVYV